jgi:hypothetical protein
MPFTRGFLLIGAFSLSWGVFTGINVVVLRQAAGMTSGVVSVGVALLIALLETLALLELVDYFFLRKGALGRRRPLFSSAAAFPGLLTGEVKFLAPHGAAGPETGHLAKVDFPVEKRQPLQSIFMWTQTAGRWHLALYLPGPEEQGNTAADLEALESCRIDVVLRDAQEQACSKIQTQLRRVPGRPGLGSDAEPVELSDPHNAATAQLIPGPRMKRYNVT